MPVLRNIGCLATCKNSGTQSEIHEISNAALVWSGDKIEWLGAESDLPAQHHTKEVWSAHGKLVVPGLIDCHTHLCFAGWRANEFELRLKGRSYQEIAQAGGGIMSTVRATRQASYSELLERAKGFLEEIATHGVCTIECKSGYGLSFEDELKILRVYKELAAQSPLRIVPTFLGAHTVPTEYKSDRRKYIDLILNELLPTVANEKLAVFCDVFVEQGAFSLEEGREILIAAKNLGLVPKIHADQLSLGLGAELAVELGAASADHLEFTTRETFEKMAKAGVVAVLLPLATLLTKQKPVNGRDIISTGVPIALATDFNPGTAPSSNLIFSMALSCLVNEMTPSEVLKAVTINAARALRLENAIGSLEIGKAADFVLIDAPDVTHWLYNFKLSNCLMTVCAGKKIFSAKSS